jgi:hypothetical protein
MSQNCVIMCLRRALYCLQPQYLEKGLVAHDPFETIDENAVGAIIAMAVRRLRRGNSDIKVSFPA